ncbi:MAG: hypothetical protein ACXWCH_31100, partial [Burkholderiales bacterium]
MPSNFSGWFRRRVDEMPPAAEKRVWSSRLADFLDGEEDDRTLRRYYDGETQRPRAPLAYAIGWALRDVGLDWCSGPTALLAAGHVTPFFRLLGSLTATDDQSMRDQALRLAFATFRANAEAATFDDAFGLDEVHDASLEAAVLLEL